jgi:hypothetical protein
MILNLLKQGLITLILFNAFNISFSAGVHWRYADPTDEYYMRSSILMGLSLLLIVFGTVTMQFTNQQTYGEFKNKFKGSWECKIYIPFTVLYRICLGFYCAV